MQKTSLLLTAILATIGLVACGGGGGDASTTQGTTTTSATSSAGNNTNCPENYRSITVSQSAISNATMSISATGAAFSFKTPANGMPSMKICFGVASKPIVGEGLVAVSDTYEIITYALDGKGATLANLLNPTVSIEFKRDKYPAGTSEADIQAKTNVYNDTAGALAISPVLSHTFDAQAINFAVTAAKAGKYVAAYKP